MEQNTDDWSPKWPRKLTDFETDVLHKRGFFGLMLEWGDKATSFEVPKCCAIDRDVVQKSYNEAMSSKVHETFRTQDEGSNNAFIHCYIIERVDETLDPDDRKQLLELVAKTNQETEEILRATAQLLGKDWESLTFSDVYETNPTFDFKNGEFPTSAEEFDEYLFSMVGKQCFYVHDLGQKPYELFQDSRNPLDPFSVITPLDKIHTHNVRKLPGILDIQTLHGSHSTMSALHVDPEHLEAFFVFPEAESLSGCKFWILCKNDMKPALFKAIRSTPGVKLEDTACDLFLRRSQFVTPLAFLKASNVKYEIVVSQPNSAMHVPGDYAHLVVNSGTNLAIGRAAIGGKFISGKTERFTCSHRRAGKKKCPYEVIAFDGFLNPSKSKLWMEEGFNMLQVPETDFHRPPLPSITGSVEVASEQNPITMSSFTCSDCSKGFSSKFNLQRHMTTHNNDVPKFECGQCQKGFTRSDQMRRHVREAHGGIKRKRPNENSLGIQIVRWVLNCNYNLLKPSFINPHGLYLLSGSHDASVRVWNVESKQCLQEMTAHRKKFDEAIHDVAFHPSKPFIASAGADGLAKVYI